MIEITYTMFPLEPVRTRTGFFSSLPNSNGHGSALLSHLKPGSNQFANSYEFEFPVRTEMSTRTHMGSNWWEWMNICSGNTFQFQNGLILNTILQNLFLILVIQLDPGSIFIINWVYEFFMSFWVFSALFKFYF